ncbi:uncharacterized protein LACBIDRAFT_317358 [Laccaria bicolor S238N-H82]|uniref:Predicted protein n=1 Tax=Laccaria bicolor (strain S238N-H82 / ATCC MYA-4686) TaxID=486041 RepID=B0D4Z9_LACBS|nr:uncharacterized protein LACBIDRAFT_317358 [Laccaria bicolor S238N-H82]EDR10432.1 predicted protein [Laccaria bicolor S238N-H82]|eukprot:XP_001878882.1 predicted protein [Laccaria bicolor S238N-H82]
MASEHGPTAFERIVYYNGITGNDEHPILVYRTDALTRPFSKPVGRFPYLPIKSVRGVFDTPLNKVWDVVGPQICDIIKAQDILWSSIDTARFFTHGPPGEEEKGTLGPVVIWIGVKPGLTPADTAHNTSQEILALLRKNGVEDVEVEWREAVLQKLAGPPLMRHAESRDPTHYARRFLTALHAVPLTAEGMETDDSQGTLTLWMHENKDEKGNPSDKVYGISNCHVLRKNTTVDYVFKGGESKDHVGVCGMRRFQRGLDEIADAIEAHETDADIFASEVVRLQTNGDQSPANAEKVVYNQDLVDKKNESIAELKKLQVEVTKYWSNMRLDRNIGYVEYAPSIKVDQENTKYTSDWGAFLAAKAKVADGFVGNVVDLGAKFTPSQLKRMFYPQSPTTFKYPDARMLRIFGCATREELSVPAEFDNEGERCLMVGKDGNATDLTVGRCSGLESFTLNEVGVESRELAIYNAGNERSVEAFAAKGDSGSLVWHMKEGKAYIVGQLHSGDNRGGSTRNHVTYCTPGWYLLAEIKKKYKYADFYRATWGA